ncbi:unnamed protein product [Agarophyton chilense]
MALEINVPFSLFNVLKYIIVFFFIDVIVRNSINRLTALHRSYCVYKGHSVPLTRPFGDRFNTVSLLFSKISLFSFALILLSISTYAVELVLEFSTNTVVREVSAPEQAHVLDVMNSTDFAGNFRSSYRYTVYTPYWITEAEAIFPRCIDTDDNISAQGEAVYSGKNLDLKRSEFITSLKRNSYAAKDETQSIITLEANSSHLLTINTYTETHEPGIFNSGVIMKKIPYTNISCYGNVFGRVGEGQMKVQFLFCLNTYPESEKETDFLFISGTGWIAQDAKKMEEPWDVKVATTHGIEIRSFRKGVVNSTGVLQILPYAFLLGMTFNRDFFSMQKYAAIFKHCTSINVPNDSSTSEFRVISKGL